MFFHYSFPNFGHVYHLVYLLVHVDTIRNRRASLQANTRYGSKTFTAPREAALGPPPAPTGCIPGCVLRSPRREDLHTARPLLFGGAATGGCWSTRAGCRACWCSSLPTPRGPENRGGTGGSGKRSLCCTGVGRGTWTATKAGILTW